MATENMKAMCVLTAQKTSCLMCKSLSKIKCNVILNTWIMVPYPLERNKWFSCFIKSPFYSYQWQSLSRHEIKMDSLDRRSCCY